MNLYEAEQCNICLKQCYSTVSSLQASDENNIKWFAKLQFIIPELDWLEESLICQLCMEQLNKAWEFKTIVLNLETKRKEYFAKKEVPQESDEFRDSSGNIVFLNETEKQTTCHICLKTFTTHTQFRQHILRTHNEDNIQKIDGDILPQESKKVYTCYDCDIDFTTKDNLLFHIENDHVERKKGIKSIGNFCTNDLILKSHDEDDSQAEMDNFKGVPLVDNLVFSSTHIGEKNLNVHKGWCVENKKEIGLTYNCDKCDLDFDGLEEYNEHNSFKHDSEKGPIEDFKLQLVIKKRKGRRPLKLFTCEICDKQFEYVKLVVEHCTSDHGMEVKCVKPYSCEKCEMRFASSANLHQHRHYHERNRKHVCSLCGKGFITKSDLTVHEYTHYNRRNYKCDKCDKAFNTNKNLRTHNLVVHTDRSLWKYGCSICEKRFPLKTNYEQHLRRHNGEKTYICHICRKSFVSNTELKRHVNLHSNIKPFKCKVCGKEYKERRTHEMHLTKAHGIGNAKIPVREKKFVCHICPSQFYDKQKLSKHLCSHSGLKPFPCNACEKKFTDKSYLKHHLKTAHNIIEPSKPEYFID